MRISRKTSLAVLSVLAGWVQASEPAILGYTEPYRTITVSAGESGIIAEMLVSEGDHVTKGQVLARLDTATLQAELDIARAENHLQAVRKQRLKELAVKASPDELEKANTDAQIKEAQVRRIESMIETRTMRSPLDGIVTEIKRDPSEAVFSGSAHVLTVVEIAKLSVNLFLPPAKALKLQSGQNTTLVSLDQQEPIPAHVEFISPVTDPASGTIRVKFLILNPDGKYRAGTRCTLPE